MLFCRLVVAGYSQNILPLRPIFVLLLFYFTFSLCRICIFAIFASDTGHSFSTCITRWVTEETTFSFLWMQDRPFSIVCMYVYSHSSFSFLQFCVAHKETCFMFGSFILEENTDFCFILIPKSHEFWLQNQMWPSLNKIISKGFVFV